MRSWFRSGSSEWWIDASPPPVDAIGAQTAAEEIICHSMINAEQLVGRVLGAGVSESVNASVSRIVMDALRSNSLHHLSLVDRQQFIAQRLVGRQLRIWQRERLHMGIAGSAGVAAPAGTSSSNEPPLYARPEGKPYVRPGGRPNARPEGKPDERSSVRGVKTAPTSPTAGSPPITTSPPLFWYEFALLDEAGDGLPDVTIEMTTPAGSQTLTTNAAGIVRVNDVPAGEGSARVESASLANALGNRSARPRRKDKLPSETARFNVVTPARALRVFTFPHQDPHQVMIVSRLDVVVSGASNRWPDLAPTASSQALCSYSPGDLDHLQLTSRGSGESARVEGKRPVNAIAAPDSSAAALRASSTQGRYVVKKGDTLSGIAARVLGDAARVAEIILANVARFSERSPNLILVGEALNMPVTPAFGFFPDPGPWPTLDSPTPPPPFIDLAVDPLHEALFDRKGQNVFKLVTGPLVTLPPDPQPDFDPPGPAADAAAVLASVVALDQGTSVDKLFQPFDLQTFDPVERRGPSKR